jgi:hypothetical protein
MKRALIVLLFVFSAVTAQAEIQSINITIFGMD